MKSRTGTRSTDHLTADQIDDALIGDLAEVCATHLTGCQACRLRLAEAAAPLASFNAVSLAWSERQSATLPLRPLSSTRAAWLPRALWAASAAAVLALGIAVPVLHHSESDNAAASYGAAAPTLMASTGPVDNPVAAREEQIARDNQMLQNIDRELTTPASLDQEYGLQTVGRNTSTRASMPVRN